MLWRWPRLSLYMLFLAAIGTGSTISFLNRKTSSGLVVPSPTQGMTKRDQPSDPKTRYTDHLDQSVPSTSPAAALAALPDVLSEEMMSLIIADHLHRGVITEDQVNEFKDYVRMAHEERFAELTEPEETDNNFNDLSSLEAE